MILANMRQNGEMIWAHCEVCGHQADANVDTLEETLAVAEGI